MAGQELSLRIGFLAFYVDYYEGICSEFPAEKAAAAQRFSEQLEQYGTVIWDGKLIGDVEAATLAGCALSEADPDCVVVVTTIAVFGGISWAAVKEIEAPLLIWNPQLIETIEPGYSMEEIVRNTSQRGTQALANTLLRQGRSFRIVTGYEKSQRTAEDLARFFSVIKTVKTLREARLLAVGDIFPLMTDILINEEDLADRIGAQIFHISNEKLTDRYLASTPDEVSEQLDEMRQSFVVSELSVDEAERSARLCAAFHSLVEEYGADAGTFNCHGDVCLRNIEIGITACYANGNQNALGRPFTCTGDLPTAFAMLLLKRLTGASMYTEVQVMDEKRNAIVIANSGEGEAAIRRPGSKTHVRGNTNFMGLHGRGASFAYPLESGPATIVSFTPGLENYRLIVAEGNILEETLPDAGALAGFFRFSHTDLQTGYTRWMQAGAVHHAATTLGHWNLEIREVAEIMGFELISI